MYFGNAFKTDIREHAGTERELLRTLGPDDSLSPLEDVCVRLGAGGVVQGSHTTLLVADAFGGRRGLIAHLKVPVYLCSFKVMVAPFEAYFRATAPRMRIRGYVGLFRAWHRLSASAPMPRTLRGARSFRRAIAGFARALTPYRNEIIHNANYSSSAAELAVTPSSNWDSETWSPLSLDSRAIFALSRVACGFYDLLQGTSDGATELRFYLERLKGTTALGNHFTTAGMHAGFNLTANIRYAVPASGGSVAVALDALRAYWLQHCGNMMLGDFPRRAAEVTVELHDPLDATTILSRLRFSARELFNGGSISVTPGTAEWNRRIVP